MDIIDTLLQLNFNDRNFILDNLDANTIFEMVQSIEKYHLLSEEENSKTEEKEPSTIVRYASNRKLGMGTGAAIGALGALGYWGIKRYKLKKKMKDCEKLTPPARALACKKSVEREIKNLRNKSIDYGTTATTLGAAAGLGASTIARRNNPELKRIQQAKKEGDVPVLGITENDKKAKVQEKVGDVSAYKGKKLIIEAANTFFRKSARSSQFAKGELHVRYAIIQYRNAVKLYTKPKDKDRVNKKINKLFEYMEKQRAFLGLVK